MSEKKKVTMSDFKVKKEIGEGAYGRAVLCERKSDGKLVVIKEIVLSNLSEQEQKDAWKETRVLSYLHHPNIISYEGSFIENNILRIVMEYADNGDLFEQIQKAKTNHFKEDQIIDWFVQICLAMKHCHDRKILHRDIKCQNIFLMKNGMVKMGDFGIAKVLDHTTQFSKTAIGTPYYLSPEICTGKAYSFKSDIWSLGCVLYELCTLQHAFDSNCMNGLIMKILRAKHSPIPHYYSPNLRNLVDALLQKDPKKRPSINQILNMDFIRSRISNLLSATMQKIEFSHTIFHGYKGGETPKDLKKSKNDQVKATPKESSDKQGNEKQVPEKQQSQQQKTQNQTQKSPVRATGTIKVANRTKSIDTISAAKSPAKNENMKTKADIIQAKKSALAQEEREKQREFRQKKASDEKIAEEKAQQKRLEIEEKRKKREQDRKEQFKQHQMEVKEMQKKFENMDAPFKNVKDKMMSSANKGRPTSLIIPDQRKRKASVDANATRKPPNIEGTKKPGPQSQAQEQRNLREFLAKKRAELRKAKKEEEDDVIQIGNVKVRIGDDSESRSDPEPLLLTKPLIPEANNTGIVQPPKRHRHHSHQHSGSDDGKGDIENLIKFSDSEDTEGEDDFVSLASMFKKILDEPPPNSEEEASEEEPAPPSQPGTFYFGGKELKLPSVTDRDSLSYRVEAIRQFIEKGLGLDKFLEIYRFVTVESDEISEAEANKKIHEILSTDDELSYYKLIQQLIVCEEALE